MRNTTDLQNPHDLPIEYNGARLVKDRFEFFENKYVEAVTAKKCSKGCADGTTARNDDVVFQMPDPICSYFGLYNPLYEHNPNHASF